ncbi:MAG: hypothetical protein ACM3IJ_05990 [Candidatus Levyibacteriota bacterium]
MRIFLQGILAGAVIFVVSFAFSFLLQFLLPNLQQEYVNSMFRPWTDPLMSLYYVYPFILGIILSFLWTKVKPLFKDKSFWKRGAKFGLLYWVASSIPGMFITYSSFNVSLTMVVVWSIGGLLEGIAAGILLARVNK